MRLFSNIVPFLPFPLAQLAAPQANDLFIWLGCAAFVVVIFNQASQAWRTMTGSLKENPTPRDTYQTMAMCRTLHEQSKEQTTRMEIQFDQRMTGIARSVHDLRLELKNDMAAWAKKSDDILTSLIRLEKKADE